MKLRLQNIGGIRIGGTLYGRGTFLHRSGKFVVYASAAMNAVIPIVAPNGGRPTLDFDGPVWLPYWIGRAGGAFAEGGYLGPVEVSFRMSRDEESASFRQIYLGVVPGPYIGGLKVGASGGASLDGPPNAWSDILQADYTGEHWVSYGVPVVANGRAYGLASYRVIAERRPSDGFTVTSNGLGIFAGDTKWDYRSTNPSLGTVT